MKRIQNLVFLLGLIGLCVAAKSADRVKFNGQELFLNGLNLAWEEFSNDIGPDPETPRMDHFEKVFDLMEAHGANSMRFWMHTNGHHTPEFDGSMVVGPGVDTIKDLRTILDAAWERKIGMILCLWSFDMQRISVGETVTSRGYDILTKEVNRQSYIDNSLVPMVEALKGHPAIIAWEIFNEPEGMTELTSWETTYHDVTMADVQAFINVCAGAIHRTDPGAQVTNGSWAFIAASDVGEGNKNYYTDERLIAAGGDEDGFLDFYTVHYYDWAGTERSPFAFPAEHWGLDKPLVVAEYYPDCENCTATPSDTLYRNGYAGSLNWSWTDEEDPQVLLDDIASIAKQRVDDTKIVLDAASSKCCCSEKKKATSK